MLMHIVDFMSMLNGAEFKRIVNNKRVSQKYLLGHSFRLGLFL